MLSLRELACVRGREGHAVCCKTIMTTARARAVGPGGGERAVQCLPCSRPQVPASLQAWKEQKPQGNSPGTSSSTRPVQEAPFVSVPGKQNFSRLPKEKLAFYIQVTEVVASLDTAKCAMTFGAWISSGSGKSPRLHITPQALERERTSAHPAYFSLQVISARRAFRVSPPLTTGPPEFERVYRAQVNCSEYFPLFLATLWVAGIFFHEGTAALCGLVYLFARLRYFQGYARSAQQRLTPLYASARALWLLVALAALGLLVHFLPRALRAALLGRLGKLLPRA
ncbi:leukotriene C4 synthase isoform X2 [Lutra lutra]|uniref:leukotriene C4 synthase isoform X2 n=1 Tax=Lutra lutra TaxID=9657 RepID=UPI001FD4E1C9|nr:leukotriene C4 synthase isoform X2 [Lutra lutra]